MGQHRTPELTDERLRIHTRLLLRDLQALEQLLERGRFETGVRRVGAELEMFLVDDRGAAAPVAVPTLERVHDPRLTTELARFNLEANLSPRRFGPGCLRGLHDELDELLARVGEAAAVDGARVLLAGSLPTLRESDLGLDMITPDERYHALNRAMCAMRGGRFHVLIVGLDELEMTHDNVMLESCNTSFQLHWQVAPEEMASRYNVAQLISAPLLAVSVNSPVLLGRRLWPESRVALFQQSVDVRPADARQQLSRVTFGTRWMDDSVVELFRDNIARFRPMLDLVEDDEDPLAIVDRGEVPALSALCLHNGTIYRWNRPCFGTAGPHLRVENRVLPAGPSVPDCVANAALFFGLMAALPDALGDVRERMRFDDAKESFLAAARGGLRAEVTWLDGVTRPVTDLVEHELLPLARAGLIDGGVEREDVDRYLGIVEERIQTRRTGSRWMLDSLAAMADARPRQRDQALVGATIAHQASGEPVHRWPICDRVDRESLRPSTPVEQVMTTELFTVRPHDLVDLVASLMDWERIRHVPVEDDEGRLVGLVTYRDLLRLLSAGERGEIAVRDVMTKEPHHVTTDASLLEAMRLMRERRLTCLPVLRGDKLVGIVTERDLATVAITLLEGDG